VFCRNPLSKCPTALRAHYACTPLTALGVAHMHGRGRSGLWNTGSKLSRAVFDSRQPIEHVEPTEKQSYLVRTRLGQEYWRGHRSNQRRSHCPRKPVEEPGRESRTLALSSSPFSPTSFASPSKDLPVCYGIVQGTHQEDASNRFARPKNRRNQRHKRCGLGRRELNR